MDFDRKMNQIFSGERILYSGKRILMGIGNDDVIQTLHSKNNRYLAFVFNRDLWCYDQQDGKSVNIFSSGMEQMRAGEAIMTSTMYRF